MESRIINTEIIEGRKELVIVEFYSTPCESKKWPILTEAKYIVCGGISSLVPGSIKYLYLNWRWLNENK